MTPMTETIALVIFFFGLMFFAVCFIISWAIYHRPKYHSLSVTKRNLVNSQQGQQSFSQHPITDEESSAILEVIEVLTKCRRAYGPLTKRVLYLSIAIVALFVAVFSPNSIWVRLGLIAAVIVLSLLLIFAAIKPLRAIHRTDKDLTVRFENWANEHPEFSEKPSKANKHRQSVSPSYESSITTPTYPSQLSHKNDTQSSPLGPTVANNHDDNAAQQPWQ
jgi:uncharacterized membrane protein